MPSQPIELAFERAGVRHLSARLDTPEAPARASAILLACGAGSGMDSPFQVELTRRLTELGFPVLGFHYAYRERALSAGKRMARPDPPEDLEAAHAVALEELRRRCPERRVILAGKSMGGRIGTQLAAQGAHGDALLLLGYPLHPPGKPKQQRTAHFPRVTQPALFLQGTRDKLCDLELLAAALERFGGPHRTVVIEGADHGFEVLKSSGRTHAEVLDQLAREIASWDAADFAAV